MLELKRYDNVYTVIISVFYIEGLRPLPGLQNYLYYGRVMTVTWTAELSVLWKGHDRYMDCRTICIMEGL
jgi:hypothetical protein